jgi:hypothetical protein
MNEEQWNRAMHHAIKSGLIQETPHHPPKDTGDCVCPNCGYGHKPELPPDAVIVPCTICGHSREDARHGLSMFGHGLSMFDHPDDVHPYSSADQHTEGAGGNQSYGVPPVPTAGKSAGDCGPEPHRCILSGDPCYDSILNDDHGDVFVSCPNHAATHTASHVMGDARVDRTSNPGGASPPASAGAVDVQKETPGGVSPGDSGSNPLAGALTAELLKNLAEVVRFGANWDKQKWAEMKALCERAGFKFS